MAFGPAKLKSAVAGWNANRVRIATMIMHVTSSDGSDGPFGAMLATGVPLLYDPYDARPIYNELDERLFCIDKRAFLSEEQTHRLWHIVLEYSTLSKKQKNRILHPLSRPAEVSSTHRQISTVLERDTSGNIIANSAGFPFDPPRERESSRKIFRIARNFASFDGGDLFQDRINLAPYTIAGKTFGARTLRITAFDEEDEVEEMETVSGTQEVSFWRRVVEMEHNPEGWRLKLWDTGTRDLNGTTLRDPATGMITTDPLKLDGFGDILRPQSAPPVAIPDKDVYFEADFDAMGMFA